MLNDVLSSTRPAIVMTGLFFALTGLAYPAAVTGIAQALFPHQANGSLVRQGHAVIGSELIAQGFGGDGYFHPRPSAAGKGYDPTASSGSNLAPTAKALVDRVAADVKANPGAPIDMLTTSASGLDPDISPQAAHWQVDRVAAARHLPAAQVSAMVDRATQLPLAGFLGEPHVNVLSLNLALDRATGKGANSAR